MENMTSERQEKKMKLEIDFEQYLKPKICIYNDMQISQPHLHN